VRDLSFTIFDSIYKTTGTVFKKPWSEWVEFFSTHEVVDVEDNDEALQKAKDGPCVLFGTVTKKRKNENVVSIDALSLDLDGVDITSLETLFEKINQYEYILYSTFRHGAKSAKKNSVRFRLVFPLENALAPDNFKAAWDALNLITNKLSDQQTKDLARGYYLPKTFDTTKAVFFHNEGKWFNFKIEAKAPTKTYADDDRLRRVLNFVESTHALKPAIKQLTSGEIFAEAGNRHNYIIDITMLIAQKTVNKPISGDSVLRLFDASIQKMQEADSSAPGLEDVQRCYDGALLKISEYQEQTKKEKEEQAFKKPDLQGLQSRLLTRGPMEKGIDKVAKYTQDAVTELKYIREKMPLSGGSVVLEYQT